MKPGPDIRLSPAGECIYCRRNASEGRLSEEHIFPLSLGGNLILPEASCSDCSNATHAFEGHCAGKMFQALRLHHQYPTRRPKKRATTIAVIDGKEPHGAPRVQVAVESAPGVVMLPIFPAPTFMTRMPATNTVNPLGASVYSTTPDAKQRQQGLVGNGMAGALAYAEFAPFEFGRLLAKIAHGFAAGVAGLDSFDPLLSGVILGTDPCVFHYVGGTRTTILPPPEPGQSWHQIGTDTIVINSVRYLFAEIRLFSYFKPIPPSYQVVIGRFF